MRNLELGRAILISDDDRDRLTHPHVVSEIFLLQRGLAHSVPILLVKHAVLSMLPHLLDRWWYLQPRKEKRCTYLLPSICLIFLSRHLPFSRFGSWGFRISSFVAIVIVAFSQSTTSVR